MHRLKTLYNKISINIINHNGKTHTIETVVDSELSLMDVVRDAGFEMGNCGGMALCASCHCYIENDNHLNKNGYKILSDEIWKYYKEKD